MQYAIKDSDGHTKYLGTTNNPRRRAAEHRDTGKLGAGDKMEVQTKAVSRGAAESVERGRLASHRNKHPWWQPGTQRHERREVPPLRNLS